MRCPEAVRRSSYRIAAGSVIVLPSATPIPSSSAARLPSSAEMDRFQYLLLMGACLVVTLPLEFVFRARVYRRPRRLVRAMALPVAIFVVWDLLAIARGHWTFTERYVTGWELPGSLPVEEFVFFLVIPVCALLTFEASRRTLGR